MKHFMLFLAVLVTMCSCKHKADPPRVIDTTTTSSTPPPVTNPCVVAPVVSYSLTVSPILMQNCMPCHVAGVSNTTGIVLSTYNGVKLAANSGRLLGAITYNPNYMQMPATAQLDTCDIRQIKNWVAQGKLNN